ncbi:MAG: 5'-nucleotidase, lipoprotein e(P4) family [Bacteroidales bacterium]|nr:5'-nucleotidase, lipoprotein e(P4) family [Bacteroidales bacterium]MDD3701293.1 5'-nucleotidase, lipoprotein e(P4) family [Bacteroidales bacterium]
MRSRLSIFILSLFILSGLYSCDPTHEHSHSRGMHPMLYATLYQQQSAEFQALCFQAYQLAEIRLNEHLQVQYSKPMAIVVDIDETVLDNSPYQAEAILKDFGYPVRWDEWMHQASAEIIPGSLDFLIKAEQAGVEVFYVSNRKEIYKEATLKNLSEAGFPFADEAHLLLRTDENEKENRRNIIRNTHEIILLVGDNLGDFDEIFETNNADERMQQTMTNKHSFGEKWIMLPNAVYGSWVDVLPGYQTNIALDAQSDSLLRGLKGF